MITELAIQKESENKWKEGKNSKIEYLHELFKLLEKFKEDRVYDLLPPSLRFCVSEYSIVPMSPPCWRHRERLVRQYSWAIPYWEALETISTFCPSGIIEAGAGNGYWAYLLDRHFDISMHCLDVKDDPYHYHTGLDWHKIHRYRFARSVYSQIEKHSDRTLFLCWPPYDSEMAYQCLKSYKGQKLIYIGEYEGGCTGDDAFFEELESNWELVKEVPIPQWDGIHDLMFLYERK